MSIEFVLCRRKDDHSVTHEIARRSLRRWPDWEPVPTDGEGDAGEKPASGESSAEGATVKPAEQTAGSAPAEGEDPKTTPTSKSRSRAATEK